MMYSNNDYRLYLEHSWGKKPEQKAAEKEYNAKYYQEHKEKWGVKNSGSNVTRGGAANEKEPDAWYDDIGAVTFNPEEGKKPIYNGHYESAFEKFFKEKVFNSKAAEMGRKVLNSTLSAALHRPVNIGGSSQNQVVTASTRSHTGSSNRPVARKKTYGEAGSGVKKGNVYKETSYNKDNRPVARKKTYGDAQGTVKKTEVYREPSYDKNNRPVARKKTYGTGGSGVRKTSVYRR